jgi:hypothetical protein
MMPAFPFAAGVQVAFTPHRGHTTIAEACRLSGFKRRLSFFDI